MRMLVHTVREHAALVKSDIAGRRADEARDRVFLHIFGHVETQKFDPESIGQLLGHLGFADAGGTGEEIVADGFFRLAQARAGQFDRRRQGLDRRILAKDHAFERFLQILEHLGIVLGDVLWRDAGDFGDHGFDLFDADGFAPFAFGHQPLRRASLVDHVDGFVGQFAVVDIARGQFDSRFDRIIGEFHRVMLFEIGLQAAQDLDCILDARLAHVDFLEPAAQGTVLFEVLAEFLVGGRAHAAQLAALQGGFEQVRGIHRAAGGGTCADHRVDFVDEEHRIGVVFKLGHHGFETLFEVAAIAGARQKRAHIERENRGFGENLGGLAVDDFACKPLGDGGFTNAGITDQKRVVLAAAAQHLNAALDLAGAADQRIDIALAGFFVEIDAIFAKRAFLGLFGFGRAVLVLGLGAGTGNRARLAVSGVFGDAMGDIIDRVVTGHVLLLQEIGRVAFAFGENRDQDIGAGDLGAAGALHMDRGALDDALEGGGRHGFRAVDIGDEIGQILVDEFHQRSSQIVHIDATGLHDLGRFGLVEEREQQVLERCKFVAAGIRKRQCGVDCLFQCVRE